MGKPLAQALKEASTKVRQQNVERRKARDDRRRYAGDGDGKDSREAGRRARGRGLDAARALNPREAKEARKRAAQREYEEKLRRAREAAALEKAKARERKDQQVRGL